MNIEKFRWVAAVIAAHPERKLYGRLRLQKTIMLLQRCGLPTDYIFSMYHYGPYSDGLQSDIALLEMFNLVKESPSDEPGKNYYIFKASEDACLDAIGEYEEYIGAIHKRETSVLELAATYDACREMGRSKDEALDMIKIKKADKYSKESMSEAFELLKELGLL